MLTHYNLQMGCLTALLATFSLLIYLHINVRICSVVMHDYVMWIADQYREVRYAEHLQ